MAFSPPTHRYVQTGTVLDEWVGGLTENGITQVRGPVGVGKSTFLLALAEGILAGHPGTRLLFIGPGGNPPRTVHPHLSWVASTTVEDVARTVHANGDVPFLFIDEVSGFPSELDELAAAAKRWGNLLRHERDRRLGIVLAGTVRPRHVTQSKGTFIGRAADFVADMIINLEPVARTRSTPGMVVEATLSKARALDTDTLSPLTLWLRPGHVPPMTRA